MPNTAPTTVTGKIGPGNSITSISLPNVTAVNFQVARGVVEVVYNNGTSFAYFDYNQTTTVTDVISGTTSTFTIS